MSFPRLRFPLFLSLALIVSVASAETIRFDPPNATVNHSVDAIVAGVWSDGCLPSFKSVVVADGTITLHLDANLPPDAGCLQAFTQYSRTFHLGVLPAGNYTVIAVADRGTSSTELIRAPLMVRDTETALNIQPYAVPTTGGQIGMGNPFYLAAATLTIGGVTVPANSNIDGALVADSPPHAPGLVDVVLNSTAGTVTAKALVTRRLSAVHRECRLAHPAGGATFGNEDSRHGHVVCFGGHYFAGCEGQWQPDQHDGLPVRLWFGLFAALVSSDLGNVEHHEQRHATGNDRLTAVEFDDGF
jgi:hypothetical protein